MTTTLMSASTLCARRADLLAALKRVSHVIPRSSFKPILQGVRLEATAGQLRLAATDLEVSLTTTIEGEGALPPCVVPCQELVRRLQAGKAEVCSLKLAKRGDALSLNGGNVEHNLPAMVLQDFPVIPEQPDDAQFTIDAQAFRSALAVTLLATARENSRYAIDGVMLESDDEGARLVATDGRRMAIAELSSDNGGFRGEPILPGRLATLVTKLVDRKDEGTVAFSVQKRPDKADKKQPSQLFISGPDWTLASDEHDGIFPRYRDVLPWSASKFRVDRKAFLETLHEVALATSEEARGVQVDLRPRSIKLSAKAPSMGESTGTVKASFEGGGDHRIITGFNPGFLSDAFKSLDDEEVIIDVGQNKPNHSSNTVTGMPALIYTPKSQAVRWLLMPINTGIAPSPETLGSNFEDPVRASA